VAGEQAIIISGVGGVETLASVQVCRVVIRPTSWSSFSSDRPLHARHINEL